MPFETGLLMHPVAVGYALIALGIVLGIFAHKIPLNGIAAIALTGLPPAGLALGIAYC
jgi:hypothetical protein